VLHITPDERQALQMLADGTATDAIADRLGMSEREVEVRLSALFARMGATSQDTALASAFRRGLLVSSTRRDGQPPSEVTT